MLYPENNCPQCRNPSLSEKEFYEAYEESLLCDGHNKYAETEFGSGTDKDA